MKFKNALLTATFLTLVLSGFSQNSYQSTTLEECKWDSQLKAYTNCVSTNANLTIEINKTEKTITITKNGNTKHLYNFFSEKTVNNTIIFKAAAVTGVPCTITLGNQNTLVVMHNTPSVKKTYMLLK